MSEAERLYFLELRAGETVMTPDSGNDINRPNGLDVWAINITTAGLGRIDGVGPTVIAEPGDLHIWRPGAIHDYGREPTLHRWTHLWVTFEPRETWHDILRWPEIMPGIGRLSRESEAMSQRLEALFREIIHVVWSPLPERERLALSLLETLLLWCNTLNPQVPRADRDPRVEAILRLLADDLAAPITLDYLARQVDLSVSRLAHLFKEQVGASPMQHLERLRLRRACDLLMMTDTPVATIASQVGYTDAAYFTSLFRRREGCTPTAYRHQEK